MSRVAATKTNPTRVRKNLKGQSRSARGCPLELWEPSNRARFRRRRFRSAQGMHWLSLLVCCFAWKYRKQSAVQDAWPLSVAEIHNDQRDVVVAAATCTMAGPTRDLFEECARKAPRW